MTPVTPLRQGTDVNAPPRKRCVDSDGPGSPAPSSGAGTLFPVAGNGIGLTSAMHLAEYHGGRLWAIGGPAAGATFHVLLPSVGTC